MTLRYSMSRVRGRGAGLGNELIPWARSFLAAQIVNARALSPAFGMNSRRYWRHFGTPRHDWLLHRALEQVLPVVEFTESDYLRYGSGDFVDAFRTFADDKKLHTRGSYVLVTEGMWGGYRHIAEARDFIFSTLYQSRYAARNLLRIAQRLDRSKLIVAMHVRMGDFGAARQTVTDYRGKFNVSLPLLWYRNIAQSIRSSLGSDVQFLIISDGTAEQLQPLLDGLPAVTTSDIADSDCSDLLALASADLLVCSVSSFSTTAVFLSEAPYLWFEPQLQQHEEGFYSIWGNEPAQQLPDGATRQALDSKVLMDQSDSGRGVPVGLDGNVPEALLRSLVAQKAARHIDGDLVRYGVVRINRAGQP